MRNLVLSGTVICASITAASVSHSAENYPDRTIEVILPWSPGGPTDIIGRIIATEMGNILGQRLAIESRPGASGTVGAAVAARAPADGYHLLMNASTQVIYEGQFASLPFDPMEDFTAIGVLGTVPMVAIVPPDSPYANLEEIIEAAREDPDALSFSSPGVATLPHLVGELIHLATEVHIEHISYPGSAPAITDVAGGHVDLMYAPLAPAMPLIESGGVRPIAVSTIERLPELPDTPTVAETVLPDFDIVTWYGLWAPKGTPEPIIEQLNQAMIEASQVPEVAENLRAQGTLPSSLSVAETQAFAQAENERWLSVMKDAGIEPQ